MRVSDGAVFDAASRRAMDARVKVEKAAAQSSTGQRVIHPGDDPVAAGRIVRHQSGEARLDALARSAEAGADELAAADGVLDTVGQLITRARELTIQLGNDTYAAADRRAGALEVDGLRRQILSLMNSQVGGRYLFSGTRDDQPAFDASGVYQGDAGIRRLPLSAGISEAVSVRADVAIAGAGGGTDVLAQLATLGAALNANDAAAVRSSLTGLEASTAQVAAARSQGGGSMAVLTSAGNAARALRDAEVEARASVEDADIIASASQFALSQRALDAALAAASKSFQLTLLDRLR